MMKFASFCWSIVASVTHVFVSTVDMHHSDEIEIVTFLGVISFLCEYSNTRVFGDFAMSMSIIVSLIS